MSAIEKIVNNIYDDEVIDYVKKQSRNYLFNELKYLTGDEEVANKLLKRALDISHVKYTICEETGLVITYLRIDRYVSVFGRLYMDGDEEDEDEDDDEPTYVCPYCGREIGVYNYDDALEVIRGERNEDGEPK